MSRQLRTIGWTLMASGLIAMGSESSAQAQGYGYGNPYARSYPSAGGYGYGGGGYNPALPYSPAQQQGWREGRQFYETGIAPNHRLSPAEARGFVAGESRQANTPWQRDPAKQQGWREGQIYWETGQLPGRPMSPAELQGFVAGERRAASGNGYFNNGGYRPY
jgi:hypothetical protein